MMNNIDAALLMFWPPATWQTQIQLTKSALSRRHASSIQAMTSVEMQTPDITE